ncbi:MAG: hypothetical protein ACYC64_08535 [Armatimonadota bacterium]
MLRCAKTTTALLLMLGFVMSSVALAESGPDSTEPAWISDVLAKRIVGDGRVAITDIRSNKVRYIENENATTKATVINKTDKECMGTLVAIMHIDVDTVREVARTEFTIAPGDQQVWEFSYNVGPETYGRGIEVRFVDGDGKLIDTWQEFYAVAAEFFRVHQHCIPIICDKYKQDYWNTYYNQKHYFASEPTDFGVYPTDAEQYLSGQVGYRINQSARRSEIARDKAAGVADTFYQTFAFCGPMGYEELRKHPEYALYDSNGQFAVDPIYGGQPNPLELASPIEIGPSRKAKKPYLDRRYQPWQHVAANLAMEDVVIYEANRIKEYARANDFDGAYWDGALGVSSGYNYDGTLNVPSAGYEDYVQLNARNHRVYSEILKKDNPNFGTWFNWGMEAAAGYSQAGHKWYLGTGDTELDPKDDSVRAATDWNNVMLLSEMQHLISSPKKMLDMLVGNRDKFVQKHGANMIYGYLDFQTPSDAPGPTQWGWATVNSFLAQLIATQTHLASWSLPSVRPSIQFMTRYSSLIWARDIRAIPVLEAEKILSVSDGDKLWWRQLAYRRNTANGYDLIVHLVRIPQTQWDIKQVEQPEPLTNVKVAVNIGQGVLEDVHAMRPYDIREEPQPVKHILDASVNAGSAVVNVPGFRYHIMLVFRVNDRSKANDSPYQ